MSKFGENWLDARIDFAKLRVTAQRYVFTTSSTASGGS